MSRPDLELVGREAELDGLNAFLDDHAGLPSGLLLEGPAGAGKTTLWRAAVEHAAEAGYTVLWCRPAGAEVQLSLGALADLLEPYLEQVLPALLEPQRRAIAVALLVEDGGGKAPDQRALAAGFLNAVRALAASNPVLIAIDDAQWMDGPSAEVIEYALRRLRGAPVAVLAAVRTTPGQGPTGLRIDRALERPPARLEVGPLSIGALRRLIGTRTSMELNRRTLQRIHETSGGNPFYALELAREMGARQATRETLAPGAQLYLSAGLTELLADRLADLSSPTRDALFIASAASQPTTELVSAVTGADATFNLAQAVDSGIVRIDRGVIEFAHPLLAAAAYAGVEPAAQRAWHARLADALEDAEGRARHLSLARPGQEDAEVAALLLDAARRANERGAPAAAAEHYAEAIDRLPKAAADDRAAWIVEAAPTLLVAGEAPRARVLLEEAIAVLPAGPLRSDALLALASLMDDESGGTDRALLLVEQAFAEAGSDARRKAAALLDREQLERSSDRSPDALTIARRALAFAEEARDDTVLAQAHTRVADLEVVLGLGGDPVERFAGALELHARAHVDAGNSAPSMLAVCLIRRGRVDDARPYLVEERLRTIAEGDEISHQSVCLFLGELEWLAGRWDEAAALAEEAIEVAVQAGTRIWRGTNLAISGLVEASRGNVDRGRALALEGLAICETIGEVAYGNYIRQILCFIELSGGDAAAARGHLKAHSIARVEGAKRLSFIGDQVEALIALGDLDRAEELLGAMVRRGQELHRPTLTGAAARCRALLLGARGDLEGAGRAATEAVELHKAMGLPFERARSLLVLGEVQRRSKQRKAARETLTEAAEAFERLGAAGWAARAEAERARVGGRSTIEGLTETEMRVAQLVAQGRSNKEVASELFVSVRAVEANLSKVYAKLEIRSRTELARRI